MFLNEGPAAGNSSLCIRDATEYMLPPLAIPFSPVPLDRRFVGLVAARLDGFLVGFASLPPNPSNDPWFDFRTC